MRKIKLLSIICLIVAGIAASVSGQPPRSHWAKYDSGKVHYYDIGKSNKKAIVFVHGWTCNADFWKKSYSAFPHYRVIAIDLPGHGKSDKPRSDYSMDYFAKSIDAVMKQAKVKQAVLIGHSMGTPVIRQFNRLYPQETIGLVIVDGALRPFGPKAQMDKFFEPLFNNYKEQVPKFIDGLLGPTRDDLKPAIRATMLSAPEYVGISAMKGMLDNSIWTNDQIKVPVLAILADSPNWPQDTGDYYKTIAPNLDFQRWPGVSHFLMMEKPKEFNETVSSFITKHKLL
ncbi:MAG: alpha/beta hydrolase [Pyrinomonadaceae bacterium]